MLSVLDQAKSLTEEILSDGDIAVDATLGNGYDAVHLARQVAPTGRLFGVDLQEEAIVRSRERLSSEGLEKSVSLIRGNHASLLRLLPSAIVGRVGAVMFNLGYLPGGDRTAPTRAETTIPAIQQAVDLLQPCGRMTIVLYRGHPEGPPEYRAVLEAVREWDQRNLEVLHYRFINQVHQPPELLVIEKL
jgi:16S rRNA C1402 N4-methylase RsmH